MAVTASQIADKWRARASTAENLWLQGIDDYDGDIGQAMIDSIDRMVSGFLEAVQSGRFEQMVRDKVSTQQWKARTKAKGTGRYSSGVNASADRFRSSMTKIMNAVQSMKAGEPPRGTTVAENMARVQYWAEGFHNLRGQLGAD